MELTEKLDKELKSLIEHSSDNNFLVRYGKRGNELRAKEYIEKAFNLIEYGANPNLKNDLGQTILHLFITIIDRIYHNTEGNIAPKSLIYKLLEKGSDVNVTDNEGKTSLMMASAYGYTDLINDFIDMGSDINAVDIYGNNAMDYAVMENKVTAMAELKNRGLEALRH